MDSNNVKNGSVIDYRAILEAVPDLYLILNTELAVIAVSNAYLKAIGSTRETIMGRSIFEIFPESPNDKSPVVKNLRESLERVMTTKKSDIMPVHRFDIHFLGAPENEFVERYWSPISTPVLDAENNIEYIVHRINDVTEFVKLRNSDIEKNRVTKELMTRAEDMEIEIFLHAQELVAANKKLSEANQQLIKKDHQQKLLYQKLEKLNQSKTNFFTNVSHELRTPLTLILGILEGLLTDHKLVEHQYNLKVIERNARQLLKLVNDLMDVAKLEVGTLKINYHSIDLARFLRQIAGLFESYAKERQIKFLIETPNILRAEIDTDKIQRVLMNLLSNAFKFTPAGGTIHCVLQTHSVHRVKIAIADGGPGIPPKMRDTLFDRFFYIEGGSDLQFGDVSLGLAMVKDFVELHGGTVTFSEGAKGGAVFTVDLPILAPPNSEVSHEQAENIYRKEDMPSFIHKLTAPSAPINEALRNKTESLPLLLIIEDNIDVNQYLSGVLSSNYRIENAYDGVEGLEKAIDLRPDLILSDVLMPRMDGIQLVQRVREHPELEDTPIIIITAKLDEALCAKLLSAGAQEYLSKPFSHAELRARVANLISLKQAKDTLTQKNKELTIANKELDELSYIVSHDLRTPLQAITGFSSMLLEYYKFEEEIGDNLRHILSASKLMEDLLATLLSFSQVMRRKIKIEKVDLSQMTKNILRVWQQREPSRSVEIIIKENISALCDKRMIEIALENLLANAWKNTRGSVQPRIEFGMIETSVPIYFVRDNGAGYPQNKLDKLFSPFTYVGDVAEYSGPGMGLAIVKRIVEKHGGHITVESEEKITTTFYMTLEKEKGKIGINGKK